MYPAIEGFARAPAPKRFDDRAPLAATDVVSVVIPVLSQVLYCVVCVALAPPSEYMYAVPGQQGQLGRKKPGGQRRFSQRDKRSFRMSVSCSISLFITVPRFSRIGPGGTNLRSVPAPPLAGASFCLTGCHAR